MTTTIHSGFLPHTDPALTDQPGSLRDCAFRDPSANLARVQASA
jgi:hypothetical protein